jgi:mRNA-degrading endonuclease RelE of RelBE toxin-antitoxin system
MARRIEFAPSAARAFSLLDAPAKQRLADVLADLEAVKEPKARVVDPGPPPAYRLREGNFRILFEMRGKSLFVMDVAGR